MSSRMLLALVLGLGALEGAWASDVPPPTTQETHADADADAIAIVVEDGYHPDRIVVKEGQPVRLAFVRNEHGGCTREVVFPTLDLRRELPTGERVVIDLGAPATGEIPFHCGMKMIHGVVVVEAEE